MRTLSSEVRRRLIPLLMSVALAAAGIGSAEAADFTTGDLVVYRTGTGAALASSGTAVFVDEYTTGGALVQSVALPTTTVGANHHLVASGSAASEGQITRSADNHYVVVTGYDAALFTTGLSGSTSASINRVVGLIDRHGAIDTSTHLSDAASGNNPRGATSDGNGNIWFAGAAGGLRATTVGATTSTQINATANVSAVEIINGQLWVSSAKTGASNSFIAKVGTGLPTTSGQTSTNIPVPGTNSTLAPNAYVLVNLASGNGTLPDTVYEADNTTSVLKFCWNGSAYVSEGSYTTNLGGVTGLVATVSGTTVTLYASSPTGIYTMTDSSGIGAITNGTSAATVAAPATNEAFRGIAFAPIDNPPTISAASDQAILENTLANPNPTTSVSFTIADYETAAAGLQMSATSSNPALVPSPGTISGGASRSVTLSPALNQIGTCTITVGVSDGTTLVTTAFNVTVNANAAPTITNPGAQSIPVNGSTGALAITVGDAETAASALVLSATSSNTALVPAANVVLSGSGADRTVTVTPAADQTGTATISVSVDDGSGTVTAVTTITFTVTVTNTAPTISSVADQSLALNTATNALAVTVGDAETPVASLVLVGASSNPALVPAANISFGGSGADRTVTVTPVNGQEGAAVITLTVTDGQGLTATSQFTVVVGGPTANSDSVNAVKDAITVFNASDLAANDSDPAGSPIAVTAVSGTTAHGGTVALVDGKVIYTPPAGYTGSDSFTYTLRDGVRYSGHYPATAPAILGYADLAHLTPVTHSGYGSSLALVPGTSDEFYVMTDRGPNGDVTASATGAALTDPLAKIFPVPGFTPEIAHVKWNADGSVSLLGVIQMKDAGGNPITGLPTHVYSSTAGSIEGGQIIDDAYNGVTGANLGTDANGLDSEGMVALADGTFWISDEYGPFLVHLDATGQTIERISPYAANAQGHKLPAVFAQRLINKGMEGLTITPDGSLLVGLMQSALDNDPVNDPRGANLSTYGANNKKDRLLRMITYRLIAKAEPVGTVHQYAYFVGDPAATGNNKADQSEITALSNTDILVDERDGNFPSDPGGSPLKKSWVCHLPSGAADDATPIDDAGDSLTGLTFGGSTLETLLYNKTRSQAVTILAAHGLKLLPKDSTPYVDLSLVDLNFDHDKIEGVYPVGSTIVYSNDDDFGLNGDIPKVLTGSYNLGVYPLGTAGGMVTDYSQLLQVDPSKLALTATATVNVTVNANTAPTVAAPADQTLPIGGASGVLAVTIGDAETPAGSLVLSAHSSNQTLLADGDITLGGSGTARTVGVAAEAGQVGSATVTLTVTDSLGAATTATFTVTVANQLPTISGPGDQAIAVNGHTGALAVTIGDAETPAASLALGAHSSNQSLLPDGGIVLGGSGANRTVAVTPAGEQAGSATVTLTVTDGNGGSAIGTFTLTVTDSPPSVGSISDQALHIGASSGPLAVTVGDNESPASSLTLGAVASNTTLLPPGSVVVGGSGANRTVTVTAAAGLTGSSLVTLTVTDPQGLAGPATQFTVTVADQAPVAQGASVAVAAGGTATGAVTATDADAGQTLTFSLAAGPSLGSATVAADGTFSYTAGPAAQGNDSFTITVSDGILTAHAVVTVTVAGENNDAFGGRRTVPAAGGTVVGTNVGATKQTGEPKHAGFNPTASVWWTWTPTANGTATIDTVGSGFDTVLEIDTGSALTGLTVRCYNDDIGGGLTTSRKSFTATAGTPYVIVVDGKNGATGAIALNVALVPFPVNDAFASAAVIPGASASVTGTLVGATVEAGEPVISKYASVWWAWTAPASGSVTIDTVGSGCDTVLGLYSGSSTAALTTLAANYDINASVPQSRVSAPVAGGTTYHILVGAQAAGGTGPVVVNLALLAQPGNDAFATPATLGATSGSLTANTAGASHEAGEPNHANVAGAHSLWYTYTAPADGFLTVSTAGSAFDTLLAVYQGSVISSLTVVGFNNNISASVPQSQVRVPVVNGQAYLIAVDGSGSASGALSLGWTFTGTCDNAATATVIAGAGGSATASNAGATGETGEPNHGGVAARHSVWWKWTAPADGTVFFTTGGSVGTDGQPLDTVIGVYTGGAVNALTTIVANDDTDDSDVTSQVGFKVHNGTTYLIAVDGVASKAVSTGVVHLTWTMPAAGGGG
jgi:hypothetical protein